MTPSFNPKGMLKDFAYFVFRLKSTPLVQTFSLQYNILDTHAAETAFTNR